MTREQITSRIKDYEQSVLMLKNIELTNVSPELVKNHSITIMIFEGFIYDLQNILTDYPESK